MGVEALIYIIYTVIKTIKFFFAFSHFIYVFTPPFRRFNFALYTLPVFALLHFRTLHFIRVRVIHRAHSRSIRPPVRYLPCTCALYIEQRLFTMLARLNYWHSTEGATKAKKYKLLI